MKQKVQVEEKPMSRSELILFIFLASLYLLTAAGYPTTSMGVSALLTATSVIEEGTFALEEPTLETGIGVDGKYYSYEGLAFLLVVSFFAALSKLLGMFPNGVFFTNSILTSLACVILFLIGRELKYSIKTSILMTLIYGVGTMAWVHSRYLMPEPLTTIVYLTAFLFLLKYRKMRKGTWLFLCGCFTGFALIVRPDAPLFILVIVSGILVLFYNDYREGKKTLIILLRDGLIFISPLLVFFALYAYYNYARFGDILELGYATKAQEVGTIEGEGKGIGIKGFGDTILGFLGMWVIPCRSMFFINPILIFIFWAVKDFWRKFRFEFILIAVILCLHVLLYSNRGSVGFPGSSAWGIRYMVPMTGFLVIVMGTFVNRMTTRPRGALYFRVFVTVFILSALFQFIGSSVTYQDTQVHLENRYNTPEDKWAARKMMNLNPRWNLITQNMKHLLLSGDINFMYINYLKHDDFYFIVFDWQLGRGFPAWVGVTLVIFVITFTASGYLLLRILLRSTLERRKVEKSSGKRQLQGKKKRRH
ncbi:MAG: hypothetical protein JSV84_05970 [Gemmatimonadota bacterium]|nr:MAG: hypothetical protein JSV84_05970 [Gemmatimonadota bacterium]